MDQVVNARTGAPIVLERVYMSFFDFDTGKHDVHLFGPHHSTGEVVYAANPESDREEDGWLLSFVHDKRENTSELVVLSAGDLQGDPVARVCMPRRVPEGFHSHWRASS